MLNRASCYASSNISFIQSYCEDDPGGFSAFTFSNFGSADRTELYPRFVFNSTIFDRGATLFHEARHADAVCDHTSNCPAGSGACDPSFGPGGCVGFLSGTGDGAYTFSVKYLMSYLRAGQDDIINRSIRDFVLAETNRLLMQNFDADPCFHLIDNYGTQEMTCDAFPPDPE